MKTVLNKIFILGFAAGGLALYQILAGVFGFYLFFQQPLSYIMSNFLIFIIIAGLFLFSILCGIILFQKDKGRGINLSLINQILQLFQIQILGYGFSYIAGVYLGVGFSDTPDIHFLTKSSLFESSCYISLGTNNYEISILLNIVALVLVILLLKTKNLICAALSNIPITREYAT